MKFGVLLTIAALAPAVPCFAQNQGPTAAPQAAAAPAAKPAPAAPLAAASSDTYVIGGNDVLTVTVWKEPTLSGSMLVRPDGMISLPLLGDVQAAGLTPLHLADQIKVALKKYVQDPNVSVVVAQIRSKLIYMMGEVVHPAPVEMTPNMTLLEALSSAGGVTEFANKKKIYILRNEGGKRQRIPVHYRQALAGNLSFDLPLKPGDTIVVP